MFSTKEKRSAKKDVTSGRNRNLEAVVRFTHDALMTEHGANTNLKDQTYSSDGSAPSQTWDEMVFENRNQEYGAYVIRKGYSNAVTVGLGLTLLVVLFIIFYPTLVKLFGGAEAVEKTPPRKLVYTELSAPPSIDKPKPPPPQIQLPRLQKVIKFVPPKVVKDQIVEDVPTIQEIKENQTGAVAVEAPADIIFDEPVEEIIVEDEDQLFTVVDQQPEFEGGYEAMMAFIKQNMKYPPNARRMQIEGTVHVSFIVSKTGTISEVKVLRGIMTECDREAVRVVQLMPAWKPGKQNGKNVNVRFILPLKFRLN
jgi:protein TonB